MRRLALTAVLAVLALAPATAEAASTVVVRGAGFGHGIGMSQYGAYGYARQGTGWREILGHYYRGTTLAQAPNRPVRVLLQASVGSVRFRGASDASGGRKLSPGTTYTATRAGSRVTISGAGKRVGTFSAPVRIKRAGGVVKLGGRAINGISGGSYRGYLELRPGTAGGVTTVNALPVDAYTRGVIAGEMPPSWDFDALRAQAVAARSYALATRKSGGLFDLYPDTRSQVYNGVRGETRRTNLAVGQTKNTIVTYKGKVAITYFMSTSGGRTENVEDSFLGSEPKPWLKSEEDPFDGISPRHRWTLRFSARSLGARLGVSGFRKVTVLERGGSPRIVRARVVGSSGSRVLTGPQIRARLGLYDTWARFVKVSTSQVARRRGATAATAKRSITGRFDPAPRGGALAVERRRAGRWIRAGATKTSAAGGYTATVPRTGTYRVRAGAIAGPAVAVR